MQCDDAVMGQEALYLDLLTFIDRFEVVGDKLLLKAENPDPDVKEILVILQFEKK